MTYGTLYGSDVNKLLPDFNLKEPGVGLHHVISAFVRIASHRVGFQLDKVPKRIHVQNAVGKLLDVLALTKLEHS
ncbi:MAG: hypothetical protein ABSB23_14390 [Bryobacteraceae bacterium]